MCKLNGPAASRAAITVGARCATDVTGFGLLGHASHIAEASGVTLTLRAPSRAGLPGAKRSLGVAARTGGAERNATYLESLVDFGSAPTERDRALLIDPQTSGGLLVAVPRIESRRSTFRSFPKAVEIGEIIPRTKRYGLVLA